MESGERAKRSAIAAGVILLLLLMIGVVWQMWGTGDVVRKEPAGGVGAVTSQPSDVIKVGWMVSAWTADEHPYGAPGTYDSVTAIRARLIDPQIELFAIIEPGSEENEAMKLILKRHFKPGHVVKGDDAQALSKMDVIVLSRDWNMKSAVMGAILKAAGNGTGLLRHLSAGIFKNDGDEASVAAINCMDEPKFFWNRAAVNCVVVSDHPLLAGIRGTLPEGKLAIANINGAAGILHGTPLIVAEEGSANMGGETVEGLPAATQTTTEPTARPTSAPKDRRIFCPMFVSQIGKGKVVACQWDSIPKPLVDATKGRFYINCVQWLAGKPIH